MCGTGARCFICYGRSIAQGRNAGLVASVGVNIGAYIHLFAAIAGLSAILAASSLAFTVVKLVGACYLVWIGLQAILGASPAMEKQVEIPKPINKLSIFWQGFLCDVLNPKVAIFYLAFLPQFVDIERGNTTLQLLILGVTVNMVGLMVDVIAVFFSAYIAKRLGDNQEFKRWFNRAVGVLFIGLGVRLARETF